MFQGRIAALSLCSILALAACGGGDESPSGEGSSDTTAGQGGEGTAARELAPITEETLPAAALAARMGYYLPVLSSRIVTAINLLGENDSVQVACSSLDYRNTSSYLIVSSSGSSRPIDANQQITIDFEQCILDGLVDMYALDGRVGVTISAVTHASDGQLELLVGNAQDSNLQIQLDSGDGLINQPFNFNIDLDFNHLPGGQYQLLAEQQADMSIGSVMTFEDGLSHFSYDLNSGFYSLTIDGLFVYSTGGQTWNFELATETALEGNLKTSPTSGEMFVYGNEGDQISYLPEFNGDIETSVISDDFDEYPFTIYAEDLFGGSGAYLPVGRYDLLDRDGSYETSILSSLTRVSGANVVVTPPAVVNRSNSYDSYLVTYSDVEQLPTIQVSVTAEDVDSYEFVLEESYTGTETALTATVSGQLITLVPERALLPGTEYRLISRSDYGGEPIALIVTEGDIADLDTNPTINLGEDRFINQGDVVTVQADSTGYITNFEWSVRTAGDIDYPLEDGELLTYTADAAPGTIMEVVATAYSLDANSASDTAILQIANAESDKTYVEFDFPENMDPFSKSLFIGNITYTSTDFGRMLRRFSLHAEFPSTLQLEFDSPISVNGSESTYRPDEGSTARIEYISNTAVVSLSQVCPIEEVVLTEHELNDDDYGLVSAAVDLEITCESAEVISVKVRKSSEVL